MIIRQGDILLMKATDAPKDAEDVPREKGRIIVAEGEATGHHHAIRTAGVIILEKDAVRWLVAPDSFVLEHEEHDPITLDPGVWVIRYQREYTPKGILRVMD